MARPVRIFVVDDSATCRLAIKHILAADPRNLVVGEASDGESALAKIPAAQPDIVLMDIVMPSIDGYTAARQLMSVYPRPIVMVSDLVGREANLNFKALQAGALDILRKPSWAQVSQPAEAARFNRTIQLLSEVPVVTRNRRTTDLPAMGDTGAHLSGIQMPARSSPKDVQLVAIGASTGGPPAILNVLTGLQRNCPWPVLVVQHMTRGFIGGMTEWLGSMTGLKIELATAGAIPMPGTVYLAPDEMHMQLRSGRIAFSERDHALGHCPSVDKLFESIAREPVTARTVAILLTGMGDDGAAGLAAIKSAGGWTIAQDEASSVVYGMPKAAADIGAALEILPLDAIGQRLREIPASSLYRSLS